MKQLVYRKHLATGNVVAIAPQIQWSPHVTNRVTGYDAAGRPIPIDLNATVASTVAASVAEYEEAKATWQRRHGQKTCTSQ